MKHTRAQQRSHLLALHCCVNPRSHGRLEQAWCAVRLQHIGHLPRQPEGSQLSNGQRLQQQQQWQ
jgi:hypothetical protein